MGGAVPTPAGTIDVHTHVVPRGLPFGHDERFARLEIAGDQGDVFVGGQLFRRVNRPAWDTAARLADMARDGVAMQVLSVMPELFSYWAEPTMGRTFCGMLNGAIADMVAGAPDRFAGLGTVPLQDLPAAVDALHEVRELGLAGVQIGSNVNGTSAGAAAFMPFFRAAADLGLCVFVHAFHPPHWGCVADPPMAAAVNFPPEIGTCMAAVIANGVLDASPRLRLGASHGGGTLPLHLPRMAAFWGERPGAPIDHVRRMWFDTLTYTPEALRALLDLAGTTQVVVGSDAPFFAERPGYVLDALHLATALAPAELDAIRRGNALAFLGRGDSSLAGQGALHA
jgi:aminocarboxymuconate-semialdehyde decarboxylase